MFQAQQSSLFRTKKSLQMTFFALILCFTLALQPSEAQQLYTVSSTTNVLSYSPNSIFQYGETVYYFNGYYDWTQLNLETGEIQQLQSMIGCEGYNFINSKQEYICLYGYTSSLKLFNLENGFELINSTSLNASITQNIELYVQNDLVVIEINSTNSSQPISFTVYNSLTNSFIYTFPSTMTSTIFSNAFWTTSQGIYYISYKEIDNIINSTLINFYTFQGETSLVASCPGDLKVANLEAYNDTTALLVTVDNQFVMAVDPETGLPGLPSDLHPINLQKINDTAFLVLGGKSGNILSICIINQNFDIETINQIDLGTLYDSTVQYEITYMVGVPLVQVRAYQESELQSINYAMLYLDINTFELLRVQPINSVWLENFELKNGSTIILSSKGYWIQNPSGDLTFQNIPISYVYIPDFNPNSVWTFYTNGEPNDCYLTNFNITASTISNYQLPSCPINPFNDNSTLELIRLSGIVPTGTEIPLFSYSLYYGDLGYPIYYVIANNTPFGPFVNNQTKFFYDTIYVDVQNQEARILAGFGFEFGIYVYEFSNPGNITYIKLIPNVEGEFTVGGSKVNEDLAAITYTRCKLWICHTYTDLYSVSQNSIIQSFNGEFEMCNVYSVFAFAANLEDEPSLNSVIVFLSEESGDGHWAIMTNEGEVEFLIDSYIANYNDNTAVFASTQYPPYSQYQYWTYNSENNIIS